MLKMVFLVRRRPGMTPDEFRRYWKEVHGPIAAKLPGLRRYVQNHANTSSSDSPALYDGFAEMWWDDAEAMQKSLASAEGQAALADVNNFIDAERMHTLSVEELAVVG